MSPVISEVEVSTDGRIAIYDGNQWNILQSNTIVQSSRQHGKSKLIKAIGEYLTSQKKVDTLREVMQESKPFEEDDLKELL